MGDYIATQLESVGFTVTRDYKKFLGSFPALDPQAIRLTASGIFTLQAGSTLQSNAMARPISSYVFAG